MSGEEWIETAINTTWGDDGNDTTTFATEDLNAEVTFGGISTERAHELVARLNATPAPSSPTPAAKPVAEQCRCFQFPHERGDRSAPCRHSLTEAEEALFAVVRPYCADTQEKRDWPRIADKQAVKIVLALAARAPVSEPDGLAERLAQAARHPYKGPNDTDAGMLRAAAKRLDGGFHPGGSYTRQTVARVCRVVADLLAAPETSEEETRG